MVTVELTQEEQPAAERTPESEEDSEYEDAEDGILSSGSTQIPAQTNFECRVCGESIATKFCKDCKDTFCAPCNGLYHRHPSRQRHVTTDLVMPTSSPSTEQPVMGTAAAAAVAVAAIAAAATTVASTGASAASGAEQQTHKVTSSKATLAPGGEDSRYD